MVVSRACRSSSRPSHPNARPMTAPTTSSMGISSNDIALIKRLVADGAGTAFLPRWAVKPELDAGSLEAVRFDLPPVRQRFGLVFRHAGRTPALAAFLATAHAYKPVIADLCASRDSPDR